MDLKSYDIFTVEFFLQIDLYGAEDCDILD